MNSPTDKLTYWLSKLEKVQGGVDAALQSLFTSSQKVQDAVALIQKVFVQAEEAISNQDKLRGIRESVNLNDGAQYLTLRQLIDGMPAHARMEDRNVTLKAKPLYKYCHPDKGGDPVIFNQLRRAVKVGDIETIYLISVKLGKAIALEDPADMATRAESRFLQYNAHMSYKIAQAFIGGRVSTAEALLVEHMENKHRMLLKRLFGE
jgi:hypothetical protein